MVTKDSFVFRLMKIHFVLRHRFANLNIRKIFNNLYIIIIKTNTFGNLLVYHN